MKNKILDYKKCRQSAVIKCFMITTLLLLGLIVKSQTALTIICNPTGAPAAMKLSELKSIMKGEKQRWNNGTKVTVALMKTTTDVGKNTARVIYNMSGDALLKFHLGLANQGISHAKFFNTISELEAFVAQNPGAIGVIDQPMTRNEIKIITIDGKTQFNL